MNRSYIDDNHVVARYLADQLSDADREAFETYLMSHPEIVQELEATARLKAGLMRLRDSGELASLLLPRPWYQEQAHKVSHTFREHSTVAAAAAIAIVAIGSAFLLNSRSPSEPWMAPASNSLLSPLGRPLPIARTYTILRTRGGADADVEIDLPATRQAIALRVLPEMTATPAVYRMTVYSMSANTRPREVAAIGRLVPESDEFVPVFLDSAKFAPGNYRLEIAGDAGTSGANEISAFSLRILPATR